MNRRQKRRRPSATSGSWLKAGFSFPCRSTLTGLNGLLRWMALDTILFTQTPPSGRKLWDLNPR